MKHKHLLKFLTQSKYFMNLLNLKSKIKLNF
jgi:hypothetical protein